MTPPPLYPRAKCTASRRRRSRRRNGAMTMILVLLTVTIARISATSIFAFEPAQRVHRHDRRHRRHRQSSVQSSSSPSPLWVVGTATSDQQRAPVRGQHRYQPRTMRRRQQSSSYTPSFGSKSLALWSSSSSTSTTSASTPIPATTDGWLSRNQLGLRDEIGDTTKFPRTWVPLASAFELNPDRPNAVAFFNQRYVAYRDGADASSPWVVADDACPHRLAPLSEGRVDRSPGGRGGGEAALECAYHGWAFDGAGRCVRIPQADDSTTKSAAKIPSKCNVKSYPVVVHKNIIWAWIWPEPISVMDGDDDDQDAALATLPEHLLRNVLPDSSTYTRDLPYGWDTLLENIVDPAHVPWAHHGMQGKRTDAIAINMTYPKTVTKQGFEFEFSDRTMGLKRRGKGYFKAPYVIQYEAEFEPRPNAKPDDPPPVFNLTTILIPTKPGWSRAIIFGGQTRRQDETEASQKLKKKRKKTRTQFILSILPQWTLHQFSNKFLDSDLAFLHYQEQERQRRGGDASTAYFMPAQSDRCIAALRKWVDTYAVVPGPLPPPIYDRKALFDRFQQHTDQCRHCTAALDGMKRWRKNTYRILALSIVLAKFTIARVAAVGCLILLRVLASIEPSFREGGFKHYEND